MPPKSAFTASRAAGLPSASADLLALIPFVEVTPARSNVVRVGLGSVPTASESAVRRIEAVTFSDFPDLTNTFTVDGSTGTFQDIVDFFGSQPATLNDWAIMTAQYIYSIGMSGGLDDYDGWGEGVAHLLFLAGDDYNSIEFTSEDPNVVFSEFQHGLRGSGIRMRGTLQNGVAFDPILYFRTINDNYGSFGGTADWVAAIIAHFSEFVAYADANILSVDAVAGDTSKFDIVLNLGALGNDAIIEIVGDEDPTQIWCAPVIEVSGAGTAAVNESYGPTGVAPDGYMMSQSTAGTFYFRYGYPVAGVWQLVDNDNNIYYQTANTNEASPVGQAFQVGDSFGTSPAPTVSQLGRDVSYALKQAALSEFNRDMRVTIDEALVINADNWRDYCGKTLCYDNAWGLTVTLADGVADGFNFSVENFSGSVIPLSCPGDVTLSPNIPGANAVQTPVSDSSVVKVAGFSVRGTQLVGYGDLVAD